MALIESLAALLANPKVQAVLKAAAAEMLTMWISRRNNNSTSRSKATQRVGNTVLVKGLAKESSDIREKLAGLDLHLVVRKGKVILRAGNAAIQLANLSNTNPKVLNKRMQEWFASRGSK